MPMTEDHKNDPRMEAALDAARKAGPEPSAALMARVLAEAEAAQAGFAMQADRPARRGYLRQLLDALGGWPAVAGGAMALVAGVWLGLSPVAGVSDTVAGYLGVETGAAYTVDVMPGAELGLAWEEGAL
jgi:hypothetical protein